MAAKSVDELLSVNALYELSFVVIAEGTAEFVEIHVLVVLLVAPPSCDRVWFDDPKLKLGFVVGVLDDLRVTFLEDSVQELP